MLHPDQVMIFRSQKSRMHGDVANDSAGDVQLRQPLEVDRANRSGGGKNSPPDTGAGSCIRKWKLHDETHAPYKGAVERLLHVGRQNGNSAIGLDALQQIAHFQIGVAVMAVAYFAAFAEKRVRFIEQKNGAAFLGGVKDGAQILLRLPN